ncbi:LOW QUALITY PROTEIN: interleukin-13 [Myotis lucifugus]|uniref:LOW QUALITY PROTEIN: interleukin-13 n=1 Tax=Myotis lucifugus TaxID=59463 RepID=UPI0003C442EA|nr:LOW QUALITY PROTEIN: interleukin-13 [Myotis lucifugus]
MALWLTLVIVLTCFGGLASPGPVPLFTVVKELIEELDNITQKVSAPLCNGSMVWSVNLTAGSCCAALESLMNISNCPAIQRTQRMLNALCLRKPSAWPVSSPPVRDTKVEVTRLAKDLLQQLRKGVRQGMFP